MKYTIILLFIICSAYGQLISERDLSKQQIFKAIIYLKNGSIITNDSAQLITNYGRLSYINIQNHLFSASETDSVFINNKIGLSYNNMWIFRIINGTISVYTDKLNQNINRKMFILNGDTISEYSSSALDKMVKNDHRSFNLVERRLLAEFGGYSFIAAGLVATAIHFISGNYTYQPREGLRISPILFSIGLTLAVPVYLTRNNELKAINNYNSKFKK